MGGTTGDPCETRVTDIEGDNSNGFVIGGATSSPMFVAEMNGDTPPVNALECYGSTIPFALYIEDFEGAPTIIKWAVFYGDADNLQYEEVGSVHKSNTDTTNNDYYRTHDNMYFFTLKSKDPGVTPHKFEC